MGLKQQGYMRNVADTQRNGKPVAPPLVKLIKKKKRPSNDQQQAKNIDGMGTKKSNIYKWPTMDKCFGVDNKDVYPMNALKGNHSHFKKTIKIMKRRPKKKFLTWKPMMESIYPALSEEYYSPPQMILIHNDMLSLGCVALLMLMRKNQVSLMHCRTTAHMISLYYCRKALDSTVFSNAPPTVKEIPFQTTEMHFGDSLNALASSKSLSIKNCFIAAYFVCYTRRKVHHSSASPFSKITPLNPIKENVQLFWSRMFRKLSFKIAVNKNLL
ncbi:uncharacterized protein LOC111495187 isoform X1 [Cucurbita maxima]|uniref:Uncharacterized protein LOC111495187 isoform X1 n=1 Tax=Cucurbita maxima TaxID=3661 RepID=A0A6J1KL77_CUCMA|nr:uncharacterized protein LOC111495187 isoform X1 [Cucurbita maxima]